MTRDVRIVAGTLGVASVLLPPVVGISLRWPAVAWVLISLAGLTLTAIVVRRSVERAHAAAQIEFATVTDGHSVVVADHRLTDAPIPSAQPGYPFLLSARVRWRPEGTGVTLPVGGQEGLAVDAVLRRSREVTSQRSPDDPVGTRYRLAATLGQPQPDPSRAVQAWAEEIQVRLSEEDANRLARVSELRKREQIWEHERRVERNLRRYLGDEVLESTGSAVVWWLARNEEDIPETMKRLNDLTVLTSVANGDPAMSAGNPVSSPSSPVTDPDPPQDPLDEDWSQPTDRNGQEVPSAPETTLARDLYPEPDAVAERRLFAHDLAQVAAAHGRSDTAERILRSVDPPQVPDPAAESVPGPPAPELIASDRHQADRERDHAE